MVAALTGLWLAAPPSDVSWFACLPVGAAADAPAAGIGRHAVTRLRVIRFVLLAALRRPGRWRSR